MDSTSMRKPDLWNTTLVDLCPRNVHGNFHYCICCLRPIVRQSIQTRVISGRDDAMRSILQRAHTPVDSPVVRMQVEILNRVRRRGSYYLCHICTPSFKKGVRQLEQERVEYPSAFLVHAVKYIEGGVGCRMNKLALLKAVVCMLSTIDLATRRRVFHPLRRKEHEVLELVLVFFRHALQEAGSNFHTIRELWCPVQVVSFARWHAAGFPAVLGQECKWYGLRQCWSGNVADKYFAIFPEAHAVYHAQYVAPLAAPSAMCAICQACARVSIVDEGYDLMLMDAPRLRCPSDHHAIAVASVLCPVHGAVCLKSFKFYTSYAKYFPSIFRETAAVRYYAWLRFVHAQRQAGHRTVLAFPVVS